MGFLDDYQPVEDRIRAFYDDYPAGRILTDLVSAEAGQFVVKAYVYRSDKGLPLVLPADAHFIQLPTNFDAPAATGYAHESVEDRGVNQKSALENCETSAIGRALANLGYAPKGARSSREEMLKVSDVSPPASDDGTGRPPGGLASSYLCPECGSPVVNNLPEYFKDSKKPAWKCGNRTCQGGSEKKTGGGNWPWATWDANFFRGPDEFEDKLGESIREDFEQPPLPEYPPGQEPF